MKQCGGGSCIKPGIWQVEALADISRSVLCCHSNKTQAPTTNPPYSVQLEGTPYHSPSYIWVRAVVWECSEGQTERQTDGRDQYTFRLGLCLTWNVINNNCTQEQQQQPFYGPLSGTTRWAGTRKSTHPPTILIITRSLSASSVYHDP